MSYVLQVKTLVSLAIAGVTLCVALPDAAEFTNSAQAGEFYTRKRVNGVWITGRFERKRPAKTNATQDETSPDVAIAKPDVAASYLDAVEDYPPPFQRALDAQRAAIVAEPTPLPLNDGRLVPLQRALEAKAKAMAGGMQPAVRSVRVVTFDLDRGLRTNIYNDGSVVEEAFDIPTGSISLNQR